LDTYRFVLFLHIVSLLIGFSAGMIEVVCLFRLRAADTLEDALPWGMLAGQIERAFPVAIIGLFATGAYMTSDAWTWSTDWVLVGIAGLVLLSVQGPVVAGRRGHALKLALQANGPGPLGPDARRMTRDRPLWGATLANDATVLGIVWLMIEKPGLGGSIGAVVGGYLVGLALSLWFTQSQGAEAEALGTS
jgi:uncharacterized membrane protein